MDIKINILYFTITINSKEFTVKSINIFLRIIYSKGYIYYNLMV